MKDNVECIGSCDSNRVHLFPTPIDVPKTFLLVCVHLISTSSFYLSRLLPSIQQLLFGHAGSWYDWLATCVASAYAAAGIGYFTAALSPANASVSALSVVIFCCVFSGVDPTFARITPYPVVNWLWNLSFGRWTAGMFSLFREGAHDSVTEAAVVKVRSACHWAVKRGFDTRATCYSLPPHLIFASLLASSPFPCDNRGHVLHVDTISGRQRCVSGKR